MVTPIRSVEIDANGKVQLEVDQYEVEVRPYFQKGPYEVSVNRYCDKHKLKFYGREYQDRGPHFPPAVHMRWKCERCGFHAIIYKSVWDFLMKGGIPPWR